MTAMVSISGGTCSAVSHFVYTCLRVYAWQVADLVRTFDDRVKEMCGLRVQVQMFIASQVRILP